MPAGPIGNEKACPGIMMEIAFFKDELTGYEISKGTIRFPLEKDIPINLVKKIVRFRVDENLEKSEAKKK